MAKEPIESTCLVVPEGGADGAFIKELLGANHISDGFQVMRDAKGAGNFGGRLQELRTTTGMKKVRLIVIVTDSAADPAVTVRDLWRYQLKKECTGRMHNAGRPKVPWEPSTGQPRFLIVTLPGPDREGGLETLILDAIRARDDSSREVVENAEAYISTTPADRLGPEKRSKALLAFAMAGLCNDPSCAVSKMWCSDKGMTPLLTSGAFSDLVALFTALEDFCLGNAEEPLG